jgi:hypothetical protein
MEIGGQHSRSITPVVNPAQRFAMDAMSLGRRLPSRVNLDQIGLSESCPLSTR